MNSGEHKQLLGTWSLTFKDEKLKVEVYEFRYLWQARVGVELIDRHQGNTAGIFAVLSTNVPDISLKRGEFVVKTYSENENLWLQMKDFPEFEDTGKFAQLPYNECPIWRIRGYDICTDRELKTQVENELYFTGTIERAFKDLRENRPKKRYKDVISAGTLMEALQSMCQALCESDYFSKDTKTLKHDKKRLVKVKGKWKIVSVKDDKDQ